MSRLDDSRWHAPQRLTRRGFFDRFSDGICGTALASLLSRDLYGATLEASEGLPEGHRRIYDLKPMLEKHNGEAYFDKVAADLTGPEQAGGLLRSPFQFAQHGKFGMWISELAPHLATQADKICVIR